MKTVKIMIKGDIQVIDYCSLSLINEEQSFNDSYYMMFHWEKLDSMTIDDNEENVIKQKGKYAKTDHFLHDKFAEDGDHPLPVECHIRTYYNQEISYYLELEDNEEFDIKKVQLLKSTYEYDAYPYFIVGDYILYDGKKVGIEQIAYDYDPESKMYDEFVIE